MRLHPSRMSVILSSAVVLTALGCEDDDMGSNMTSGGNGGISTAGSSSGGSATSSLGGAPARGGNGGASNAEDFDPQVPPTSAAQTELWLQKKFYADWVCESEPNAKTDGAAAIHVHGAKTRVCSNVRLAASTSEAEFPAGAASVKEIYDAGGNLTATVLSVKVAAESDAGKGWYWYESPSSAGLGLTQCTGCHQAAGADADHPGAGDFVYFQVRGEAEIPPLDPRAMQAWLDAGHYKSWSCEDAPNMKTDGAAAIHVHGVTRVCNNPRLAASVADHEFPSGVASVKEEYSGSKLMGHVVSLKVAAKSGSGDGWYWYAGASSAGFGLTGCTGCHSAAGSDADHPGAGDYVYFKN